jgi:hypothetical protein
MELGGVQFTATNTIIAELAQDWSTPEGGQLIQVLFQDVLPRFRCRRSGTGRWRLSCELINDYQLR